MTLARPNRPAAGHERKRTRRPLPTPRGPRQGPASTPPRAPGVRSRPAPAPAPRASSARRRAWGAGVVHERATPSAGSGGVRPHPKGRGGAERSMRLPTPLPLVGNVPGRQKLSPRPPQCHPEDHAFHSTLDVAGIDPPQKGASKQSPKPFSKWTDVSIRPVHPGLTTRKPARPGRLHSTATGDLVIPIVAPQRIATLAPTGSRRPRRLRSPRARIVD